GGRHAAHEIDELAVARPGGVVAVDPGRGDEDLVPGGLPGLPDEERVSGRERVIREAGGVRRPVGLRDAPEVRRRRTARDGHGPDADVARAREVGPAHPAQDRATVGRELELADLVVDELREAAAREVPDLAAADAGEPDVDGAVAIGEE